VGEDMALLRPPIQQSVEFAKLLVDKHRNEIPNDFVEVFTRVCNRDAQENEHTPEMLKAFFSSIFFAVLTAESYPRHQQYTIVKRICILFAERYASEVDEKAIATAMQETEKLIEKHQRKVR